MWRSIKRVSYLACLAAPLAVFSSTSHAGGELHQPHIWSGAYAGISAGYAGEANFDGVFDGNDTANNDTERLFLKDLDLEGVAVGVHVGYNWQRGNLVLGIEADISKTNMNDRIQDIEPDTPGQDNISAEVNYLASLRGRLGFASDTLLVYATGGVAFVDAKYTAVNANDVGDNEGNSPLGSGTVNFDSVGYVVGAGVEKDFSGMRFRIEGLYYGFDDKVDTSNLAPDSDRGDFAEFEDIWTVRAGVSVPLN